VARHRSDSTRGDGEPALRHRGRQKPLLGNLTRRRARHRQLLDLEAEKKDRQREKSRKVTNELMPNVGV
jgi:hypothetical protein